MRRALIQQSMLRCSRLARDATTRPSTRKGFNASRTLMSQGTADLQRLEEILSHPTLGVVHASAFFDNDVKPRIHMYLNENRQRESAEAACIDDAIQPLVVDAKSEAFLILMMKALCDAKRLEDVRLVFAIALREILKPSTELFNVLLIGITWSDTFTADEIDNVWALMTERRVERDAVTDLCFLQAYVRLQRFAFLEDHWGDVRDKCANAMQATLADPSRHPLPVGFSTKLSQAMVTLIRMAPQAKQMWELLDVILPFHRVAVRSMLEEHLSMPSAGSSEKHLQGAGDDTLLASRVILTTKILLTCLTACLSNAAVRSADLKKLFQALLQQYELEYRLEVDRREQRASELQHPHQSQGTTGDTSRVGGSATNAVLPPRASVFASQSAVSELNVFRLMARCLRDSDVAFAKELFAYVTSSTSHQVLSTPEAASQFRVAMAQVVASAALQGCAEVSGLDVPVGHLEELFDHLEAALPQHTLSSALSVPMMVTVLTEGSTGTDPKPVQVAVSTRAPAAAIRSLLTRASVSSTAEALQCVEQRRARGDGRIVTLASVHRVLDAFAALGEADQCRAMIASLHDTFGLQPTAETYEFMVMAAIEQATRLPGSLHVASWYDAMLEAMQRCEQPMQPTPMLLRALLKHYVHVGDTAQALLVVQAHRVRKVPLDRNVAAALLRELCYILDKDGVGATLGAWRDLNGGVDPRVLRMCEMTFHKWGIDIGDVVVAEH